MADKQSISFNGTEDSVEDRGGVVKPGRPYTFEDWVKPEGYQPGEAYNFVIYLQPLSAEEVTRHYEITKAQLGKRNAE